MTVYLKLRGPNDRGLTPKAAIHSGWNDPGYKGVGMLMPDEWYGMRLDDFVVIDCDNDEAMEAWLAHIDKPLQHTWVRKTPHGYHFIYDRRTAYEVTSRKLPTIHLKMELKTGVGHQVVMYADGYSDITQCVCVPTFDPDWLPSVTQNDRGVPEWDEVPDGIGDNFMISVAGKMREWGASEVAIKVALAAVNRELMPTEPMPDRSIKRIAKSAAKYDTGEVHEVMCPSCGSEFEVI